MSSRLRVARRRTVGSLGFWCTLPLSAWLTVFFLCPLTVVAVYSFLQKGLYGGVVWKFSIRAYAQVLTSGYGALLARTLLISTGVTCLCVLLALPAGYALSRSRRQTFFLFLIIVPFWTNSLIRINAWITILGNQGFLNEALKSLGFITRSLTLLYHNGAVIVVLTYMFLPYAIFPIFAAIDRFDFSLLESACDLGSTPTGAIIRVLLPNIKTGIATAVFFTFIPVFGSYTVPLLVGGKDSYLIGNAIVDQVRIVGNWPLASAFAMLVTLAGGVGVLWILAESGACNTTPPPCGGRRSYA